MSRRFSDFVLFLVLGVAIALIPIACSSDNGGTDGPVDHVGSMTGG
jgi:hypothetical protein